jgi:ABC-type uncharacterized transport system substrate-binding protein
MTIHLPRREFIATLASAAAAWPLAARAQQPTKLPTIGFLGQSTCSAASEWVAAFVQRLRELGWIENRTVAIDYRWAEGREERFAEVADEFVRLKVDVIVTSGTPQVLAAKQATSVIPIIFATAGDPVGNNLVTPTMYESRDYVEAGGLMSYGVNFPDLFRRAADYVDKILRGTKPGNIPVEQPTKFDLIINLTTAKVLGLAIPETFLLRANELIE